MGVDVCLANMRFIRHIIWLVSNCLYDGPSVGDKWLEPHCAMHIYMLANKQIALSIHLDRSRNVIALLSAFSMLRYKVAS